MISVVEDGRCKMRQCKKDNIKHAKQNSENASISVVRVRIRVIVRIRVTIGLVFGLEFGFMLG